MHPQNNAEAKNEAPKKPFRMLFELISRKDKFRLIYICFLTIINSAIELLGVGAIPALVLVIFNDNDLRQIPVIGEAIYNVKQSFGDNFLLVLCAVVLVIFVLKNLYHLYLSYEQGSILRNIQVSLNSALFKSYLRVPYTFHLNANSRKLFRNLNSEINNVINKVLLQSLNFVTQSFIGIGIVILLITTEPLVSLLIILLFATVSALFLKTTRGRIKAFGELMLELRTDRNKTALNSLDLIKEIKILNKSPFFIARYVRIIRGMARVNLQRIVIEKIPKALLEVLSIAFMLTLIIYMLNKGIETNELIALLTLYAIAMARLMPIAGLLSTAATTIRFSLPSIQPVYDDIRKNPEENLGEEWDFGELREGNIELKALTFGYEEDQKDIITDLNLSIELGTSVAFVGESGAGKTTIVDLIMGLLDPRSGTVTCGGQDIFQHKYSWRENIGYIPQDITLINTSLLANICLGLEDHQIDRQKLEKVIEKAQLSDFVNQLPEGLDTLVGDRGMKLSGGQKQRVGIARALYQDPPILIMDEATSALDNLTERFFVDSLNELKKNRTLIMIAHRMTTIENCDRIYFLKEGQIQSAGTYDELLVNSPDFKKLALTEVDNPQLTRVE